MAVQVEQLITEHLDLWSQAQTAKSTSGRGSNNKIELTGIKKLRELILELAVRGKLVPQDPNDEPASELLKRIATEKEALIKAGKLKKQKPLSPITDDEKPFEIPKSWQFSYLGDLGNTQTGSTPSKSDPELFGSDVPFIKPGDISEWGISYDGEFLSQKGATSLGRLATPGSILMVCIGTIGKCGLIERECAFNQQINSITPYVNISDYLLIALKAKYFQMSAWASSSSTTIAILNKNKWSHLVVPLPPVGEQNRVASKVDELMALCDQLEQQSYQQLDAHNQLVDALLATLTQSQNADELASNWQRLAAHFDTLFTTEYSINALKQTILQLAVMGNLCKQDPNDVPASELLKRIAAEKEALVKAGKIKKQKPLPPISDDEKPFELPDGWEWVRLADISYQITDGAHHTPVYIEQGVPFISVKDLSKGFINFSNTRYISKEQHAELTKRCNAKRGDLLLTKVGTTGIPVLIDTDLDFSIFVSVALVKFSTANINGDFLVYLFNSPLVKKQSDEGTQGVGNKNLVLKTISSFLIPIPPFKEQVRIREKLNQVMDMCHTLSEKQRVVIQTQTVLADALVAQVVA